MLNNVSGEALKLRNRLCVCTLLRPLLLESWTVIEINKISSDQKKKFWNLFYLRLNGYHLEIQMQSKLKSIKKAHK